MVGGSPMRIACLVAKSILSGGALTVRVTQTHQILDKILVGYLPDRMVRWSLNRVANRVRQALLVNRIGTSSGII
jgi:hypothetical protein